MAKDWKDCERIIVSCTKDGKGWFIWHKDANNGKNNQPKVCKFEDLQNELYMLAVRVGKIKDET